MIRSPRAAQRNGLISKENFERFGPRPNPYILAGNKPKSDRRDYFSLTPKTKPLRRAQLAEEPEEPEPEPAEQVPPPPPPPPPSNVQYLSTRRGPSGGHPVHYVKHSDRGTFEVPYFPIDPKR